MTIDKSQFFQVFFEEAAEHLAEMESLLLELDVEQPDAEMLNAIFRAAHSIKGGAGTFGFQDMAHVTHVLETLLDRLRKGERHPTVEMVDAFLDAGDVLKAQLAAHQDGQEYQDGRIDAVCERLDALSVADQDDDAPLSGDAPADRASTGGIAMAWELRFQLARGETQPEERLLALAQTLQEMGSLERVQESLTGPVVWRLTSSASGAELLDILAFVCDPDSVDILEHDSVVPPDAAANTQAEAVDPGYGFFGDAPGIPGSDPAQALGYGFFPDAPGSGRALDQLHEGYGLFGGSPGMDHAALATEAEVVPPPAAEPGQSVAQGKKPASARQQDAARATGAQQRRPAASADSSIRVSVEKVDQLINLVGELVITHAMLAESASTLDPVTNEAVFDGLSNLERNSRDLQQAVMSIRMMPISFVFNRFPRVVRDTAASLGKKVNLKLVGEDTELDKGLIERLADPLNHLVRNSIDHGVESPERRLAAGKPEMGEITLRASHQGGNIVIEVSDDGAGLNRAKLLAKAVERGIPISENPTDKEVWQLILAPGFSTADQVTDISGRGVGMDVVRRNIEAMNGRIDMDSSPGQGTRMTIRLPLTLAILDGMSVRMGKEIFILPLTAIRESIQPRSEQFKTLAGRGRVLKVGGDYLSLIVLQDVFDLGDENRSDEEGIVVIVDTTHGLAALLVHELVAQHQVVIKSLETNYRKVVGVSGATIMGDGRVALILDVDELVRLNHESPKSLLNENTRKVKHD